MTYMKGYEKLETCVPELRELFVEVSMKKACQITAGRRTPDEQLELYKKGRIQVNGVWTVNDKKLIVTNCDGFIKKSYHNSMPLSQAVDVMPLPIDWNNIDAVINFSKIVFEIAKNKGINIRWGGNFTMRDYPHWEMAI